MYDHTIHCGRKNFLVVVWKPKKVNMFDSKVIIRK